MSTWCAPARPITSAKSTSPIPRIFRVVMTGLASANDAQAVTIHFGSGEFTGKYKMLVDNFSQWQPMPARVQSIDFAIYEQVVVNPETSSVTATARKDRFIPGAAAWRRKIIYL